MPLLKKISSVAWQNIHFHGHYTFCGSRHPINLDAMVANLTLEEGGQRATSIVDPIRLPKCHGKSPDGNFGGLGLQPPVERVGEFYEEATRAKQADEKAPCLTSGPTFVTLRPWQRTLSASDSGPTARRTGGR